MDEKGTFFNVALEYFVLRDPLPLHLLYILRFAFSEPRVATLRRRLFSLHFLVCRCHFSQKSCVFNSHDRRFTSMLILH